MKKLTRLTFISLLIALAITASMITTGCAGKNTDSQYPTQMKEGSAQFYLNEGIIYLNSGNLEMAEKRLNQALKKSPTMIAAINAIGIVYLNQRQFQKAANRFNQLLRINPEYYDAYNYLGVIYTEMGEYNLAKENLLRAANAEKYRTPENAFANLAMLEIKQNRYDAAMRYVEKGLLQNDHFAPLCNLMGVIYENRGQFYEALAWYEKAISVLTEPEVTYLVNMGRVYTKMGDKQKALDNLEKALSRALSEPMKVQIRQMIANIEKK